MVKNSLFTRNYFAKYLKLNHQNLDAYKIARILVKECYLLIRILPTEERYSMASQMKRAALSVPLNIAEGSSRRSENERKRYFEIARGSIIELDAALDVAIDLNYIKPEESKNLGDNIASCFKLLSGLIKSNNSIHH